MNFVQVHHTISIIMSVCRSHSILDERRKTKNAKQPTKLPFFLKLIFNNTCRYWIGEWYNCIRMCLYVVFISIASVVLFPVLCHVKCKKYIFIIESNLWLSANGIDSYFFWLEKKAKNKQKINNNHSTNSKQYTYIYVHCAQCTVQQSNTFVNSHKIASMHFAFCIQNNDHFSFILSLQIFVCFVLMVDEVFVFHFFIIFAHIESFYCFKA